MALRCPIHIPCSSKHFLQVSPGIGESPPPPEEVPIVFAVYGREMWIIILKKSCNFLARLYNVDRDFSAIIIILRRFAEPISM